MRHRRRAIIALLTFLLLGAAVNFFVAWMFAAVARPLSPMPVIAQLYARPVPAWPLPNSIADGPPQNTLADDDFGVTYYQASSYDTPGTGARPHYPSVFCVARSVGVPFRCLADWRDNPTTQLIVLDSKTQTSQAEPLSLPTHILWPGFIANTLVYAATLAALWFIPRSLIARSRRRRNRCPTPGCNYALDGLKPGTPCPECGKISARS